MIAAGDHGNRYHYHRHWMIEERLWLHLVVEISLEHGEENYQDAEIALAV